MKIEGGSGLFELFVGSSTGGTEVKMEKEEGEDE
jgi:hypothetical protein